MTDKACADCGQGVVWQGTENGKEITLESFQMYLTSGKESKKCIILIADIFGYKLINSRIYADQLAESVGCDVIIPDFFEGGGGIDPSVGDAMVSMKDPGFLSKLKAGSKLFISLPGLMAFLMKFNSKRTIPKLNALIPLLKEKYDRIGAIGFCWGGKYSSWLGAHSLVDCYASVHPASLEQEDLPSLQTNSIPGLYIHAIGDRMFADQHLETIRKCGGKVFLQEYQGVFHGFAIRGDDKDPSVVEVRNNARELAIRHFKEYL